MVVSSHDTKVCRSCGTEKPIDKYYVHCSDPIKGKVYQAQCKECHIEQQRYRKLGVCNVKYDEMLLAQRGKCAICFSTLNSSRYTKFCVDHNHTTGQVRGLLCVGCNTALGLMKESPERFLSAVEYLKKFQLAAKDIV